MSCETINKILQTVRSEKQFKLDFDPYAFVRTTVMRTLLFRRDDYERMFKLSYAELAKYIRDSNYKKEIDELALTEREARLIEKGATLNFNRTLSKIRRISSSNISLVIDNYLMRYDIFNLKTIIRGKHSNTAVEKIKFSLMPCINISEKEIDALLKDSVEEIVKKLSFFSGREKSSLVEKAKKGNIEKVEDRLDKFYYSLLLELAKKIPNTGIKELLILEMDLLNVKLALRSKLYKINFSEIADMFFKTKTDVYYVLMQRAARGELEPLFVLFEKTRLRQILRPHRENVLKSRDLGSFEHDLERLLLRKALLLSRKGMLSVDSIIGFMFAKEIEIKNIKAITKARFLGMDDATVRKSLALV